MPHDTFWLTTHFGYQAPFHDQIGCDDSNYSHNGRAKAGIKILRNG